MKFRNFVVLTSVFIGFSLVGCQQPAEEAEIRLGTHPTCDREPEKPPTRPLHIIRATDGEITVTPDPLVQPPGPAGFVAWLSPTHNWRVTYTDGSPLTRETYEGEKGRVMWDTVRTDAECRAYSYEVEVWRDTVPPRDIKKKTYPATVATDTVNGDQIEPW